MTAPADDEALARKVLAALSDGDTAAFGELAAEGIEIETSRGVRTGHAEAIAWAANKYDHLQRRYAVDRIEREADGSLFIEGNTEYVWKDGGEVADSSPVEIEMNFDDDGKLSRWRFVEDE